MRLPALLIATASALFLHAGTAVAAPCPGADPCPWTGTPTVFGHVSPASLRGGQDVAYDVTNGIVWVTDSGRNQLKRYNATTGAVIDAVGSEGSAAGQFDSLNGIAVDGSGNVYVADTGNNRVQKLSPAGAHLLTVGDGTQGTGNNQLVLPLDVAVDGFGNLYVADTQNQRVQRFDASTGAYEATIGGTEGSDPGEFGAFSSPGSLAVDSSNNLYAADAANNRIQKFDPSGGFLAQAGTSGSGPGQFFSLRSIAVLGSTLYATESTRFQRMDATTATFGGNAANVATFGTEDGEVSGLAGVAAGTGAVFTVEGWSNGSGGVNRLQKFNPADDTHLLTFGTDAPGQLLAPSGVAVDASGNVYVAENNKDRVVKFEPDGDLAWAIGTRGTGNAEFNFPTSATIDGTHVLVSDAGNSRIQRLDVTTGAYVSEIAPVSWDSNSFPTQVAVNGSDLYVADAGKEVVWKVEGGTTTTVFHGTLDTDGTGPGELDSPRGVAVQGTSLWVADSGNDRLKKLALADGAVQSTVGSLGSGNGQFNFPRGLAATPEHLYVADDSNHRIQRLDGDGAFLDKWGEIGVELGQFRFPPSVAVIPGGASDDSVYVLDSFNDRVQLFSVGDPFIPPATTPVVTLDSVPAATKDPKPPFSGTASAAHNQDSPQVFIDIYSGSSATGTAVRTITVDRTGSSWSTGSPTDAWGSVTALPDGVYTAQARQENPDAPTPIGKSEARTFEVDTTAPVVDLSAPADNSTTTSVRPAISGTAGNKAGLSADSDIQFELHRRLGDGSFEHVHQGPIVNGFWTVPKASPFSTTVPTDLAAGTYHLRAYQHDAADNHNPQDTRTSRLFTVVVSDTTAPNLGVNSISTGTNGHLSDNTPLLGGTAGNATGDDTEVRVLVDKLINGVYENQGNRLVNRNGGSWAIEWPDTLSDGPWRVRVEQQDAANNEKKVETTFTIDTKAPTLSMFYPVADAPYTHYKQGDETIVIGFGSKDGNERSQVTGELSFNQPGAGFQLRKGRDQVTGERAADGSWAINLGKLAPGHWFMRIYLQDQAGNEGNVPVQWFVDPDGKPAVTVHTPEPNAVFYVGDTITPSVTCVDEEDGALPCDFGPAPLNTGSAGERVFTARATDKNGQTTTVDVPYKVVPPPADRGIRVDGIELTQGTQTYNVEIPDSALLRKPGFGFALRQAKYQGVNVVPNKATLARVFIHASRKINAYLYVFNGNKLVAGPLSPLPHAVDLTDKAANEKQRAVDGGALFSIPPSAVTTDTMEVVAVATPNTTPSPEACSDCRQVNGFALTNIKPMSARGWKFTLLQVNIKDNPPPSVLDDLKKAVDIFPVDPTKVIFPAKYKAVIDGDDIKGTTTARQGTILDRLDAWDEAQGENLSQTSIGVAVPPRTHLAGGVADGEVVFTPKVCTTGGGFIGIGQTTSCAYKRADIVVGAQQRWYTSVGHELGHALAREHASAGCKGADNGQIAEPWPDDRGRLFGIGFDVQAALNGSPRILDGNRLEHYDFMSYCAPNNNGEVNAWTSPKGWESLFETLHSGTLPDVGGLSTTRRGRAHTAAGEPAVVVRAIDYGDSAEIVSVAPGVGTQGPADSPYKVAIHDKNGALLGTVPMKTRLLHADDGSGKTFVVAETAVPAAAAESLTVLNPAGTAIATETRTPNAPKVAVTAPKAGARVGGPTRKVKLAWTATDADGGELLSSVEYSTDGGKRWNEVVAGTTAKSITVDRALLGASKNARIRVRTNDGWNETAATSGKFTSLGAPPAIEILEPTRRLRANNDQILSLVATATDDLNRQLSGKAITWRAGGRVVGRGARTSAAGLPAGRVKLTATARDRLGRTAVASVRVRLGQAVPRFLKLGAPKKVSRGARKVTLRAATTVRATLRAGGRKYQLDRKTRRITVPISPSKKQLVLQLNLKAGSKRSKSILVVKRG